jgi:glycosyltransferase involved in cell wall biosynthesis
LPRADYLALVGDSQIFFSPTLFESFGMALLEAAAAGLAIVTSCGAGMEHVSEMFEDGRHAYLVPNQWSYEAKVGAYVSLLERLIADAGRRREMGAEARSLVEVGPFSIEKRNRALRAHYERLTEPIGPAASAPPLLNKYRLETREFSEAYCASEIALRHPGAEAVRIHL